MSALSSAGYADFARTRISEAREAIVRHTVCAYTGVCLGCGRPGPCATLVAARQTLAHHTRQSARHRAAHTGYGHRRLPMMTGDVRAALPIEELRTACLAAQSAVERAQRLLAGGDDAGVARWGDALTDAWAALGAVYAGLAEARTIPGATPPSIREVIDGLAAAQADAERAGGVVVRVRRQLAAAEDRLRRTSDAPAARVAADRWRAAIARLDLVAARLALGARAVDRYVDTVTGADRRPRPRPLGCPRPAALRAGARTAGAVLLGLRPATGWRGYLARLRRGHRPLRVAAW